MGGLLNADGLASIANNLIDRISGAISWIATHDTPTRIAVDTYIQDIKNSNYDPITKAALISQAKKSIKEYCNQRDIVNVAVLSLLPTAQPERVEDDWISQFMDKARLVSDIQFQVLWGNILAGECNAPGSIPKSLLHIMEQLDKEMANAFLRVASVSVSFMDNGVQLWTPVITGAELDDYYKSLGITYDDLVDLQSVGLINMKFGIEDYSYFQTFDDTPITIQYHSHRYSFDANQHEVPVGNVIFTRAGNSLCRTIVTKEIEGFFQDKCISLWETNSGRLIEVDNMDR